MTGRAVLLNLVMVLALAAAACTETRKAPASEGSITGFDPSPSHISFSFAALNEMARSNPADVRQAALKHLQDRDPRIHYGAIYALALTATADQGDAQLVAMLTSANIDERLLSAASLAGTGDKRGLPVLIGALDQTDWLSYRSPPQRGFEFARTWLVNLTNEDFGLKAGQDETSVAATKPAWQQWWSSHQATLHFDKKTHRYAV